eukprot:Skav206444  [mRNA]  locus=scaffold295:223663:226052:+ [translate_table: standard]
MASPALPRKGHCLRSDLDGALQTFQNMIAKGVQADTVMQLGARPVTLLVAAAAAAAAGFMVFIAVMNEQKLRPGWLLRKIWWTILLDQAGTMQLDSKLCTCLISACFHNGAPEKALMALKEVKSLPNCDGPDVGTYEQLIEQLVKVGMW